MKLEDLCLFELVYRGSAITKLTKHSQQHFKTFQPGSHDLKRFERSFRPSQLVRQLISIR